MAAPSCTPLVLQAGLLKTFQDTNTRDGVNRVENMRFYLRGHVFFHLSFETVLLDFVDVSNKL